MSRHALVWGMLRDVRHHPDKAGVFRRAIRKLARARKAVRIVFVAEGMAGDAPVPVFVAATGNGFMRDIAAWLVEAAGLRGRTASLVDDRSARARRHDQPRRRTARVLRALRRAEGRPPARGRGQRLRLHRAAGHAVVPPVGRRLPARVCSTLDINPHGVDALRACRRRCSPPASSVRCRRWIGAASVRARPIDVLFMGGSTTAAGPCSPTSRRTCTDATPSCGCSAFDRPGHGRRRPGCVFGDDKYDLLASATDPAQPAPRPVDAPPDGREPRRPTSSGRGWSRPWPTDASCSPNRPMASSRWWPGVHFVEAEVEQMADVLDELLADPERLEAIAVARSPAVTEELALQHVARHRARPTSSGRCCRAWPTMSRRAIRRRVSGGSVPSKARPPVRLGPFRPYLDIQRRPSASRWPRTTRCDARRGRVRARATARAAHHRAETPSYAAARPDGERDRHALQLRRRRDRDARQHRRQRGGRRSRSSSSTTTRPTTVARSSGATSRDIPTCRWCCSPRTPTKVSPPPATRACERARADKVMVMDADNLVYPTCLRTLADALDDDPTPTPRTRSSRTSAISATSAARWHGT